MKVWEARSLLVPGFRLGLYLTRTEAEASVGTDNRHRYAFAEVEQDVVFLVINSGWDDEGGGTVAGVYATHKAAADHSDSKHDIEIWGVKTS